jgi:hypothetical protein
MQRFFLQWVVSLFVSTALFAASDEASSLYYEIDSPAANPTPFEVRFNFGYDFSNPYLQTYAAGGGVHWLASKYFGFGIDAAKYASSKRDSTRALESTLGDFGFQVLPGEPDWSTAAVFRLTPFAGLINFFSWKIIPVDICLLGKAGIIRYTAYGMGFLYGAGLEVNLGFGKNWGVFLAASWEDDRVINLNHQSRVGFRVGPKVRF